MFLGGQTVTFGNVTAVIGRVSMVEVIGFSSQSSNDWYIRTPANVNPAITIRVQNTLMNLVVVEIYARPWIVEDSRNVLTPSMIWL